MTFKSTSASPRVIEYLKRANNMSQYKDKTFDTTLDEEYGAGIYGEAGVPSVQIGYELDDDGELDEDMMRPIPGPEAAVTEEMIDFWGSGLTPSFYIELTKRYNYWSGGDDSTMDLAERAIIKQVCMLEVTINRDSAQGKSIEKNVNALNSLLGSMNLKPVQKKDNSMDNAADNTPFGMWIRKIENTEPIPEAAPEFQDVDGIVRYIHIWFFGHLCKMVGIKNSYSRMYEEEMARLRVERPEYEEEDDDSFFEDLFNKVRNEEPLGGDGA